MRLHSNCSNAVQGKVVFKNGMNRYRTIRYVIRAMREEKTGDGTNAGGSISCREHIVIQVCVSWTLAECNGPLQNVFSCQT